MDNRGAGRSSVTNISVYSIALMARDTQAALQKAGWWDKGGINLVGLSMGGMIAQELYIIEPTKFRTVTLVSTTSGGGTWHNLPPWSGIWGLVKMSIARSPESKTRSLLPLLLSPTFLAHNKVVRLLFSSLLFRNKRLRNLHSEKLIAVVQ